MGSNKKNGNGKSEQAEKAEKEIDPAELISTEIVPNEKGKLPRGLRRCQFVKGKPGDDLFLDYLEKYAQHRYERTKAQLEKWMERESTRIDELRDRYAGVSDPKKALQRQIERLQKKLVALQNG